jgi:DNA-binding transcriptional ArsR family regulator
MNALHDDVWRALGHPVRRAILDVLRDGPRTSGEVVEPLGVSRHVGLQHLAVLRDAGLVLVEKQGRQRLNYLNAVPLQDAIGRWLTPYQQDWAAALVGLRDTVEGTTRKRSSRSGDKDSRSA